MSDKLPKWNLNTIYPGARSQEFIDDVEKSRRLASELTELAESGSTPVVELIERSDYLSALVTTYYAYASALLSTDTSSSDYIAAMSMAEDGAVAANEAESKLIHSLKDRIAEFDAPELKKYRLRLSEIKVMQEHQMSPEEESLANEMMKVSASSWERLQAAVTSSIADGDKTLIELRGMATAPDRAVRKAAFCREINVLREHQTALAAALNGVKGTVLILERRRGWKNPIDRSIFSSRITEKALDALIGALEDSLPMFRVIHFRKQRIS